MACVLEPLTLGTCRGGGGRHTIVPLHFGRFVLSVLEGEKRKKLLGQLTASCLYAGVLGGPEDSLQYMLQMDSDLAQGRGWDKGGKLRNKTPTLAETWACLLAGAALREVAGVLQD